MPKRMAANAFLDAYFPDNLLNGPPNRIRRNMMTTLNTTAGINRKFSRRERILPT
jgi:hypothetical protein